MRLFIPFILNFLCAYIAIVLFPCYMPPFLPVLLTSACLFLHPLRFPSNAALSIKPLLITAHILPPPNKVEVVLSFPETSTPFLLFGALTYFNLVL